MRARHLLPVAALAFSSDALAYKQPRAIAERPLEVAAGSRTRIARLTTDRVPGTHADAWQRFVAAHGAWTATWDRVTGAPTQIWGEGIAASGAMADPAVAARVARRVLDENVALFGSGSEFALAQNVDRAGVRSVVFEQRVRGMQVVGARVRFVFTHDRLVAITSTVIPDVAVSVPGARGGKNSAARNAVAWIERAYGATPSVLDADDELRVLPIVRATGVETRVVTSVRVELTKPRAKWTVYVDAATGEALARHQELLFADGTVSYRVPMRYPKAGYSNVPAVFAKHRVNGASITANGQGKVSWTSGTASITPALDGLYAHLINVAGTVATTTLSLAPGATAVWDGTADEFTNAQLAGYVHANIAKAYARVLDPNLAWLDQSIPVHVNEDDVCNAYSELDDIHFFRAGDGGGIYCENAALVADILYHEFGHSLHGQTFGFDIDDALSEGIGDYYGATITGDPKTGTGWIDPDEVGVRDIDPDGKEYRWPDDIDGDPHMTGLIISGALWDLRKAKGQAFADKIFYGVISRSDDIPGSYVEALVTDDDDGNLANGTPNQCAIGRAFGIHGLGELGGGDVRPEITDRSVRVAQLAPTGTPNCAGPQIASATIEWELRGNAATKGSVPLALAGGVFSGELPHHEGEVIRYSVHVTLDDGSKLRWPRNAADPQYEYFDGPVTNLYCTDFETDPVAEGWTLDGFEWGVPAAAMGTTDPAKGFAGHKLLGTALAGTGDYAPNAMLKATSPAISVGPYTKLRLHYRRWLSVEDAMYDQATIASGATALWTNLETPFGGALHQDNEWRFHDVDLASSVRDGKVQVSFALATDDFYELGGWNIDHLCIVAAEAEKCPDGTELPCDDGMPEPTDDGGCCSTSGGSRSRTGSLLLGLAVGAIVLRRRRR